MTVHLPAWLRWLLLAAALASAAGIAWLAPHTDRSLLMRGYLSAALFVLGLALGCMVLRALHNLTEGDWGVQLRPVWDAAARTLPLVLILFIPVAFTMPELFPWARAGPGSDELWSHRQAYLNAPFFLLRGAGYFLLWILASWATRRFHGHRGINAAALIVYLFTITHASFDWIMSREVHLYSTAFGLSVALGQTLSAMAFSIICARPADADLPAGGTPRTRSLFNDTGNILLTLVVLWMYVAFMQFLVIWMGNTQEDNAWYVHRGLAENPGEAFAAWRIVGLLLLLLHFFIPFFLLLFRGAKQFRPALVAIAGLILAAHVVETYWLIAPSDAGRISTVPQITDFLFLLGLPALWLFSFLLLFKPASRPFMPEAAHD